MNYRWRIALTLLLTWTCVGSAIGFEEPAPGCQRQHLYVFRGFVGYWPDAFGMAKRISMRGYQPHIRRSNDVPDVTSALLTDPSQGAGGPINLLGYSYGASAIVTMAGDLQERGVFVDRMVLIECYDHPVIPANVRYCLNIYESRPLDRVQPFRGTPARAADPSSTLLVDIDIACAPEFAELRKDNHFNIADDPRLQDFVAQQFPDLMPPAPGTKAATGLQKIALPNFGDPTGGEPTLRVQHSPGGNPHSNAQVTHQELRGAQQNIPNAAHYGWRQRLPFGMAKAPGVHEGGADQQSLNYAQQASRELPAGQTESIVPPSRHFPSLVAPAWPFRTPTFGSRNSVFRTTRPDLPYVPDSTPYSSYRTSVSR